MGLKNYWVKKHYLGFKKIFGGRWRAVARRKGFKKNNGACFRGKSPLFFVAPLIFFTPGPGGWWVVGGGWWWVVLKANLVISFGLSQAEQNFKPWWILQMFYIKDLIFARIIQELITISSIQIFQTFGY